MSDIASAAVFFPEKAAVYQSSFQQVKPTSCLVLTLMDGSERTFRIPMRVGRILQADLDALPQSVSEAVDYIDSLQRRAAFSYLVDLLSRRDHSTKEIQDKLKGQGFSPSSIESAVEKARQSRYLDDARFASYFVDERVRRGWGRIKIEQELRRKGVDPAEIPGYPEEYFDEQSDVERAAALLARKSIPENKPFEKLVRHLMSKGFSYSIARDAVQQRLCRDS